MVTKGVTGNMVTNEDVVEKVAARVIELLDTRTKLMESLKKETAQDEREQYDASFLDFVVRESAQAKREAYRANCKHEHKLVHTFPYGEKWTKCLDFRCDKVWKEKPAGTSRTVEDPDKTCNHCDNKGYSMIYRLWSGTVRCSRCMQTWSKAKI